MFDLQSSSLHLRLVTSIRTLDVSRVGGTDEELAQTYAGSWSLGFRYLFRDAEIPVPAVIIDDRVIPDMHVGAVQIFITWQQDLKCFQCHSKSLQAKIKGRGGGSLEGSGS